MRFLRDRFLISVVIITATVISGMFIFHRQVNKGIQSDIASENALLVIQVPAPSQEPAPAATAGKININTASVKELDTLPYIGYRRAQAIIAGRPYASIEEITKVPRIGPKIYQKLKDFIIVSGAAPLAPSQEPVPVEEPAVEEKPVEVKVEEVAPPAKSPALVMKKIDTDGDGIPDTFVIKGEPGAPPTTLAKRAAKRKKTAEGKVVPRIGNLRVTFIDVGQGDGCLIQTPGGKNIIIDGGRPGQGQKVVSLLRGKGIRRIDCVVATHPDMDHIGGLIAVLNSFEIGVVLDIGHPHTTRTYEDFLETIEEKNISYRIMKRGDALDWGEEVSVQVLNPPKELHGSKNEDSIVLRLVYGKISFLFTGDIGRPAEEDLVTTYHKNLRTTILKCPHHGSRYSSTSPFLEEVRPEVVIISVGRNSYGHPTEEAMDRYREIGTKIYRTDIDGNITVTSDGRSYQVRR
ncbi:helix-hairpin-helix domain-containing protein, partial [bacterium]|nr:helix-hairpin-helix domain-containing protein [bacterium]